MDPLFEELIAAVLTMTVLGVVIAFFYWGFTGNSPWPHIVIAEALAFSLGLGIITLGSPRRRR